MSDALLLEADPISCSDDLLKSAAGKLKGTERRQFLAEVCQKLCDGNARLTERRFGWGRETIERGAQERHSAARGEAPCASGNRGKQRSEVANPQLAIDIQLIVEPNSHCDPELKSERRYTNMTSAEAHAALKKRGYTDEQLPSQRTLRDILNQMNYRLKRIRKAKPLKKTRTYRRDFRDRQSGSPASRPVLSNAGDIGRHQGQSQTRRVLLWGKNTDRF